MAVVGIWSSKVSAAVRSGQQERDRTAEWVNQGVDFGSSPTARPNRLSELPSHVIFAYSITSLLKLLFGSKESDPRYGWL